MNDTAHFFSHDHFTSDFTKMTTNLGDSAVYKLDLKQAASLRSEMSYPIYTIFECGKRLTVNVLINPKYSISV